MYIHRKKGERGVCLYAIHSYTQLKAVVCSDDLSVSFSFRVVMCQA